MAANVLLQPCGLPAQTHFQATIQNLVPRERIMDALSGAERSRISGLLSNREAVATWGIGRSNNSSVLRAWRDLSRGDVVLFAGLKKILASGVVIGKTESKELGNALWGSDGSGSFELIYFLEDVVHHNDLTVVDFNRAAGYQDNARPQNARLLTAQRAASVLSFLEAVDEPVLDSDSLKLLNRTSDDTTDDLDEEGAILYRSQQLRERSPSIRTRVLDKKGYICEVCGYEFARQFGEGFVPSVNVHHKNPLGLGARQAQSIDEFAVLCAPCHTAAHMGPGRKLNPWTIDELRKRIRRRWDG